MLKRCFDLALTIPGLLLLLPVLLLVMVLIWLDDHGPIFFRQERIGYKGKTFRMWKFRTMVVNAEALGKQITVGADPRITRIGHFLRKCKLDEFPQLFNIITGEMSLVGPRPEVPRYVAMYSDTQRHVLDVMPGITDPASIKYRDENDILAATDDPEKVYIEQIMPEKIRINLDYVANASLATDLVVILNTLQKLFRRK